MSQTEERILFFLRQNQNQWFRPSQISLAVGYEKGKNSAATVNPALYSLLNQGLVKKITEEGGKNPQWSAK